MGREEKDKGAGRGASRDEQIREALARGLRQQEQAGEGAGARVRTMGEAKPPPSLLRREVFGRVSRKDVYIFCRELAILLECGMPMVKALNSLAGRLSNHALARIAQQMGTAIEEGSSFTDAVRQHGRRFPALAINMIQAGEASGALVSTLHRIADQGERMEAAKSRGITVMIYPIIVLLAAAGVICFAFGYLTSAFQKELQDTAQEALKQSRLMQVMLDVGALFRMWQFWGWVAVVIIILVVAYLIARRLAAFRLLRDRVLLSLPIVRGFVRQSQVAHFARVFGMLLQSGVPLLEALAAARETTDNEALRRTLEHVAEAVRQGKRMAPEFERGNVFPALVPDLIAIGEEAGSLDRVFTRLADVYEVRLQEDVARLGAIVQPVIVVVLAAVVGLVALTLFSFYVKVITNLAQVTGI